MKQKTLSEAVEYMVRKYHNGTNDVIYLSPRSYRVRIVCSLLKFRPGYNNGEKEFTKYDIIKYTRFWVS